MKKTQKLKTDMTGIDRNTSGIEKFVQVSLET